MEINLLVVFNEIEDMICKYLYNFVKVVIRGEIKIKYLY